MSNCAINCLFTGPSLGNQLFNYAFARGYAEKLGVPFHCNEWLGSRLFLLDDKPITEDLPLRADVDYPKWVGEVGISIKGYAMRQVCLTYTRSDVKKWFQFKPKIADLLTSVPIHEMCAHIRHGDFLGMPGFVAVSVDSYMAACAEFGFDVRLLRFVNQAAPVKIQSLEQARLGFTADFYRLMRARILFRANSSFSWWAATLGNAERVFSPVLNGVPAGQTTPQDAPFVEGNWPSISNGHWFVENLHLAP